MKSKKIMKSTVTCRGRNLRELKIYEKRSHMSKSKLISDKCSKMSRSSVIIPRNNASLCAE